MRRLSDQIGCALLFSALLALSCAAVDSFFSLSHTYRARAVLLIEVVVLCAVNRLCPLGFRQVSQPYIQVQSRWDGCVLQEFIVFRVLFRSVLYCLLCRCAQISARGERRSRSRRACSSRRAAWPSSRARQPATSRRAARAPPTRSSAMVPRWPSQVRHAEHHAQEHCNLFSSATSAYDIPHEHNSGKSF